MTRRVVFIKDKIWDRLKILAERDGLRIRTDT